MLSGFSVFYFLPRKAKKALENGADPNYIGPEGFAAIHLAAGLDGGTGQQLLNLILMYGGNPNLMSLDHETALHVAVMWNRDFATRELLAHGADPTLRNMDGLTAFDLAESTSDQELKCLDLLRSKLDNSSESDTPVNERSVLFVPAPNTGYTARSGENRQYRSSEERSNEFLDVTDGQCPGMSSQMRNMQGYPHPSSNQKVSPNFAQFPYNPQWIQPGNDTLRVPYYSQHFSNGVYGPQLSPSIEERSQLPQKDSFFDISVPQRRTIDSQSSHAFANIDQQSSDTDGTINTAFTWDSDIDSSTSYFSLPKHSLRGLITELRDGEERVLSHRGVSGEASVIIGSDFESRISLGEIPLSLIKNTNESILNEQLRKAYGKKSAEKLFSRRAKLHDVHSSKKMGRNYNTMRSSPEVPQMSPSSVRMQRPTFFRSPFPLIKIPSNSFGQNVATSNNQYQSRTEEVARKMEICPKVDKTTQKYLDSAEDEDKIETRQEKTHQSYPASVAEESTASYSLPIRTHSVSRMIQVGPSSVNHGSSADINVRTPTTDETFSQPGNEETENEFSLLHAVGSPRALYADMNETPSTLCAAKTLFDRNFLDPSLQTGNKLRDGDIFKFGADAVDSFNTNETTSRTCSTIERKVDVLNPNETDVFPAERETGSDGSSSGYGGDLSQASSPDDVASALSLPKFEFKDSPSVTIRSKRRKGVTDGSSTVAFEKQSSTDSSDVAEGEDPIKTKTALSASPRKRLNGVASSSDEVNLPKRDIAKSPVPPKRNTPNSPGHRIRQRVDHTFERNPEAQSQLLPADLRAYHKAQLEKPTIGRRQWETKHKNGCPCEVCMTKKGQAAATASLPYCEHDQCIEMEECTLNDVTIEYDWKDVSLMESTNTEHSIVVSDEIKSLNTEELKQRLTQAGLRPGPITEKTMNVYMRHLARIETGALQTEKVRRFKSICVKS